MSAVATRPAGWSRTTAVQAFAVIVLGVVVLAVLSGGGQDSSVQGALPQGFPVPSDARLHSDGDVVTFDVRGPAAAVETFYRDALPPAGWTVADSWQGQDPHGSPATGFVVERSGDTGAIAFTTGADGRVVVQVNLHQPEYRDTMSGMGQAP